MNIITTISVRQSVTSNGRAFAPNKTIIFYQTVTLEEAKLIDPKWRPNV